MENYKRKYEQAMLRMNKWVEGSEITDPKEVAEFVFPELRESEDERIRKEIIEFLKIKLKLAEESEYITENLERWIDWLEKQDPKKHEEELEKAYKCADEVQYRKGYEDAKREIENQNEQNPANKVEPKFKVGDTIHCKYDDREFTIKTIYLEGGFYTYTQEGCSNDIDYADEEFELVEQKPTDKAEPKFKIEKEHWYVCIQSFVLNGNTVVIKGQTYKSQEDNTVSGENARLFIDKHDGDASKYFRPWTIQDAKDGDVLAVGSGSGIGICIFDGTVEEGIYPFAYCGLTRYGFESYNRKLPFTHDKDIHPATKEQCDLLFKKMHEAGYEWNAEKKELKKIEQNPAWDVEDEEMFDSIIADIQFTQKAHNHDVNQVVYEREIDWFKSLKERVRPQPKFAWSEEDERIFTLCALSVKTRYNDGLLTHHEYELATLWLESLRDRMKGE